jgi:hypothetical protein
MKKILFASDVKGKFKALSKLSEDYDLVFCVGETCTSDGVINEEEMESVKFKVPIFFIESGPMKFPFCLSYPDGGEVKRNFTFLGRIGVKTIDGFRILYNSSEEIPFNTYPAKLQVKVPFYTVADQNSLLTVLSDKGPIDFFLSNIAPLGVGKYSQDHSLEDFDNACAMEKFASELISSLSPRYCIYPSNFKYLQREPFEVSTGNEGNVKKYTRMIYIPRFLHQTEKFLFALRVFPLSVKPSDETVRPQNATENPFKK